MVLAGPFSDRVSVISTAEKKSSRARRRSRPRSSQYFTTLGSMGDEIPVMKSLECRWFKSKLGLFWTLVPKAMLSRVDEGAREVPKKSSHVKENDCCSDSRMIGI